MESILGRSQNGLREEGREKTLRFFRWLGDGTVWRLPAGWGLWDLKLPEGTFGIFFSAFPDVGQKGKVDDEVKGVNSEADNKLQTSYYITQFWVLIFARRTETQKGEVTCLRSHDQLVAMWALEKPEMFFLLFHSSSWHVTSEDKNILCSGVGLHVSDSVGKGDMLRDGGQLWQWQPGTGDSLFRAALGQFGWCLLTSWLRKVIWKVNTNPTKNEKEIKILKKQTKNPKHK